MKPDTQKLWELSVHPMNLFLFAYQWYALKPVTWSGTLFLLHFLQWRKALFSKSWGGCCYSVAQSCPTLWNTMDCSTPGFPVLHHLLELGEKLLLVQLVSHHRFCGYWFGCYSWPLLQEPPCWSSRQTNLLSGARPRGEELGTTKQ